VCVFYLFIFFFLIQVSIVFVGKVMACDGKLNFDENAFFRQQEIEVLHYNNIKGSLLVWYMVYGLIKAYQRELVSLIYLITIWVY
jgi:hypothetical protein